ncbi:hypothetical protein [Flavobacterium daemonense]|uniref:hypothetical protein n=1 Tax=Flavobacterium daemonense TaxID=1393049 RepID=UPI001186ABAA|nr:hypothetical protein [Flavobacterium daemonense]KAF2332529.1 hypothetical protein FND99_12115 [Flavobacterium daemonense]
MNFDSLKNITPLTFYFASVICLALSNVARDKSLTFYYILLVLGVGLFFMGVLKRIKTKR